MKRIVTFFGFGIAGIALFGCPIYGDEGGYRVCNAQGCYDCPSGSYSASCKPWACNSSLDCPNGYDCNGGACVAGNSGGCTQPTDCPNGSTCGVDGQCHVGDCGNVGCVSGYVCKVSNGVASCVKDTKTDGGSGDACVPECVADATCVTAKGAGAKCLNGTCVAPADQCADATQCQNGYQCVQGVCTPSCSDGDGGSKPCPTGFSCDTQKGVCTGNPNPCTQNAQCMNGTVCTEGHCVNPCNAGVCPNGFVCVGGGCIPDQKPMFVCNVEGKQDVCKQGSLCLRHNCYIACDADASMSCKAADQFNICKQVTTMSGSYSVCGSASNLGSDCDPTIGKNCGGGLVCIDGYCR